jgi:hypothetical protein
MPANVEKRKPHFARKKQKRKPPAKGSTVPEEKRPPRLIAYRLEFPKTFF